jgi:RNA polymerase primary sigma factor
VRQLKISTKITSRDSISLDKYLSEISKISILTADEEVALAQRIKSGDQNALEELTSANLRFVVSVAKQYQNNGLSLSDLINEGNVGLIKAANRFDETKGFKFISYAVWWIRQSIIQAIVEYSRMVRVPVNKMSKLTHVMSTYTAFVQKHEREPSMEELAELCEISKSSLVAIWNGRKHYASIDAPIGGDQQELTMLDMMPNDEASPDIKLMEESLAIELKNGLSSLSPREYEILSAFFGINGKSSHTLDEIADLYGLTRERVRQIRERALRRLRRKINRQNLNSNY